MVQYLYHSFVPCDLLYLPRNTFIPAVEKTTQMTVKELMPRQKYRFRARCRNRIGWSKWGHSAVFSTLDAGQIALISPTAITMWRRGTSVTIQFEATETIKGDVIIELSPTKTRN